MNQDPRGQLMGYGITSLQTVPFIIAFILLDFSLTVKAATLIFISGRGSAISSAKEGNQVLFIIW